MKSLSFIRTLTILFTSSLCISVRPPDIEKKDELAELCWGWLWNRNKNISYLLFHSHSLIPGSVKYTRRKVKMEKMMQIRHKINSGRCSKNEEVVGGLMCYLKMVKMV